jgi:dihydrofolate reductase
MTILTRMCCSLDGNVTTPDGWPVQLAFDGWDAGALGFYELQARCDSVLMGRTTFEPALGAPHWPWGDLNVFVLGSHLPEGSPDHVVVDSDPARLLEKVEAASTGKDVNLVGGPATVEAVHRLGKLDEIHLMVLPIVTGSGRKLTPELDLDTALELDAVQQWPGGVVELAYRVAPAAKGGDA